MATSILQNDHVWIGGVGTFCFISQLLILVTHTQAENSVLTDILVYIFFERFYDSYDVCFGWRSCIVLT